MRWGRRLLYVVLLIAFVVVFGQEANPRTFPFLIAILALILPALFAVRENRVDAT